MALGCGLTSVRGDRGENFEKCQKHIRGKKNFAARRSYFRNCISAFFLRILNCMSAISIFLSSLLF
jgi:hypothetical protein